jgi:hypothetical protein
VVGVFLNDFVVRDGVEDARVDAVEIDGLKAVAAVAFNAAAVALEQDVRADFRVFLRNAISLERVDHEVLD